MPAADKRLTEIVNFYCLHGAENAMEKYSIGKETLGRYKRQYRELHGDLPDLSARIKEKYSAEEIENLLNVNNTRYARPIVKHDFTGQEVSFLVISDTHFGSKFTEEENVHAAFAEAKKEGCTFCVHSGDVLEGMSTRPGQIYELSHIGYSAQKNYAAQVLSEFGLPIYFITGNHDHWFNTKSGVGIDVGDDLEAAIPHSKYLGMHEGIIDLNGCKIMLWHGEDGSSYATSYRLQKIIEMFTGGEKPNILFAGHVHKHGYFFERNVHAISSGCIQNQTPFMRFKRLSTHKGFWIVKATIRDGQVVRFSPTWYPYYS